MIKPTTQIRPTGERRSRRGRDWVESGAFPFVYGSSPGVLDCGGKGFARHAALARRVGVRMESRLERARPWQSGVALRLPPQSIEGGVLSWPTHSLTQFPSVTTFRNSLPFRDAPGKIPGRKSPLRSFRPAGSLQMGANQIARHLHQRAIVLQVSRNQTGPPNCPRPRNVSVA